MKQLVWKNAILICLQTTLLQLHYIIFLPNRSFSNYTHVFDTELKLEVKIIFPFPPPAGAKN